MDEPTNDLDAETLELLEELVNDYAGTLLLVSHDRAFLNNVATSILAVDHSGQVKEYGGGYDDYQRAKDADARSRNDEIGNHTKSIGSSPPKPSSVNSTPPVKLSFKEKKELADLPNKITQAESELAELHERMALPDYFKQPSEVLSANNLREQSLGEELERLLHRWEELEAKAGSVPPPLIGG